MFLFLNNFSSSVKRESRSVASTSWLRATYFARGKNVVFAQISRFYHLSQKLHRSPLSHLEQLERLEYLERLKTAR